MSILKGFLVVLVVYLIGMATKFMWWQNIITIYEPLTMNSSMVMDTVLFFIGGVIIWLARGGIGHLVCSKLFKADGSVKELLYGYGMSYFPYAIVFILSLFIFSNAGTFVYLFFVVFAPLLVYAFFVNAVMMFYNLDWKKGLATVLLTEAIIAGATILIAGMGGALTMLSGANNVIISVANNAFVVSPMG